MNIRKIKRVFNLYNIAIVCCIASISIGLYILLVPEETSTTVPTSAPAPASNTNTNTNMNINQNQNINANTNVNTNTNRNTNTNTNINNAANTNKVINSTTTNTNTNTSTSTNTNTNASTNKNTNTNVTPGGVQIVDTNVQAGKSITEDEAKEIAIKQLKVLGETATKNELTIKKIKRSGELYYYVTSRKNTMEIKIEGGKITRINSAPVKE